MNTCFASNLWYLRRSRLETQAACATAMGMSRSTYANYEAGINQPRLDMLEPFIKHFGVSAHELLYVDLSDTSSSILHDDGEVGDEFEKAHQTHSTIDDGVVAQTQCLPAIVSVELQQQYARRCHQPAFIAALPKLGLRYEGPGQWRAFEVGTHPPAPLRPGDLVLARLSSLEGITEGGLLITVSHQHGVLWGRCRPTAKGIRLVRSTRDGDGHTSHLLQGKDLVEVWLIVECWSKRAIQ